MRAVTRTSRDGEAVIAYLQRGGGAGEVKGVVDGAGEAQRLAEPAGAGGRVGGPICRASGRTFEKPATARPRLAAIMLDSGDGLQGAQEHAAGFALELRN